MNQSTFKILIILPIATTIATILRVYDLSIKSFWTDELLSICHAQSIISLQSLFAPFIPNCLNAHPPLYFLLLKLWSFGGDGEYYLRILSVLMGVLTVPMTYLLGRQFLDKKVCLLASCLIAISPLHVLYDREVRMYSLFTFLTLASLYFFIRALKEDKVILWSGYVFLTVLNLYTHYHAFLVIFFELIYFIMKFRTYRRAFKSIILPQAVITSCFAFWIPNFFYHLKHFSVLGEEGTRFPITFGPLIKPLYIFFSFSVGQTILPWNWVITVPAAIIFAFIFIFGLRILFKDDGLQNFILLAFFIPLFTCNIISDLTPRYVLFLSPVYSLIIAQGIVFSPWKKLQPILIILIVIILSNGLNNYYKNKEFHIMATVDPWREVGEYLQVSVMPSDVLFNIGGAPINFYTGFHEPVLGADSLKTIKNVLVTRGKNFKRIWLVVSDPRFKNEGQDSINWMQANYGLKNEKRYVYDPDYLTKARFFRKDFVEYRIKVFLFDRENAT